MDPATHLCGDGQEAQCVSEIENHIEQLALLIGNAFSAAVKRLKSTRVRVLATKTQNK
jgi:hypothetical protein